MVLFNTNMLQVEMTDLSLREVMSCVCVVIFPLAKHWLYRSVSVHAAQLAGPGLNRLHWLNENEPCDVFY